MSISHFDNGGVIKSVTLRQVDSLGGKQLVATDLKQPEKCAVRPLDIWLCPAAQTE